jgi:hypothetical protein
MQQIQSNARRVLSAKPGAKMRIFSSRALPERSTVEVRNNSTCDVAGWLRQQFNGID